MSEGTPILNPELRRASCCSYGDWFALDLLVELWQDAIRGDKRSLSKTCPACGAQVTVDWTTETVRYEPLETTKHGDA